MAKNKLKISETDVDWENNSAYYNKEFNLINANTVELTSSLVDRMILRQNPFEKNLIARQIRFNIKEGADLDLLIINEGHSKLQQVIYYNIDLETGSTLSLGLFAKGGKLNKHIFNINVSDNCCIRLYGHASSSYPGYVECVTKLNLLGSYITGDYFFTANASNSGQTSLVQSINVSQDARYNSISLISTNYPSDENSHCYNSPKINNKSSTSKINIQTSYELLDFEDMYYLQLRGIDPNSTATISKSIQKNKILSEVDEEILQEIDFWLS